jgi:hypothetical protein
LAVNVVGVTLIAALAEPVVPEDPEYDRTGTPALDVTEIVVELDPAELVAVTV